MLLFALSLATTGPALATKAKDVGRFYGVRENTLSGPGLVVGLRRTGDSPSNAATVRSLVARLQGHGLSIRIEDVTSRNAALVMVRAALPPDYRPGDRVDVTVASTSDATSLEGGMLVWTPLFDQSKQLVAIAEGPLVVGGYAAQSAGNTVRKNAPTTAMIPGGALIERENDRALNYAALETTEFVLDRPDFATAAALEDAVNAAFGSEVAQAVSASTVRMAIPEDLRGRFPRFAAQVEAVDVTVAAPARVAINERTGTVVMGGEVTISPVAVAHGGLTVEVRRVNQAIQPSPLSFGTTAALSNVEVEARESEGKLLLVEGAQIADLVAALNALGVKPRDLVVILHAIRRAGALQAEIVTL